jgi:hypothetical protein
MTKNETCFLVTRGELCGFSWYLEAKPTAILINLTRVELLF